MAATYDTLDLKQLRCLWATARHGSLTRAGIELGVSESAIAQRLRALERTVGVKLYETPGGRFRLTQQGELVLQTAYALFERIDAMRGDLEESADAERVLTVAAEESAALYLLPDVVRGFSASHPNTRFEIQTRSPGEVRDLVARGDADLGVTPYVPFPSTVVFKPWREFPGYLVAPLGHPIMRERPITLEAAVKYPVILPEPGAGIYERVQEVLSLAGLACTVRVQVGGWETVKRYVALGMGIAPVCGICLTATDRLTLDAVEIPEEYSASTVYGVVLRKSQHRTALLDAFLKQLSPALAG